MFLYAPYTNIGNMNFESTTGYINIPDKNVVFTRLDEEGTGADGAEMLAGVDANNQNQLTEGQKMIFDLQDATKKQKLIDATNISEPQLLAGIDLDKRAIEKRKINDQLNEDKAVLQDKVLLQEDADLRRQFQKSKDKAKQSLFRERQVDDLHALIYGKSTDQQEYLGGQIFDDVQALDTETNRFDGNPLRFKSFARPSTKRLLKKRFITG